MKRAFAFLFVTVCLLSLGVFHQTRSSTNGEPDVTEHGTFIEDPSLLTGIPLNPYAAWKRPDGPPHVALQVGHWKNKELPDEFTRLREQGGGTSGGGKAEWEVSLAIAEATAALLRAQGITVDILPATVPPKYWADVFVSIHADGNVNSTVAGYKVAAPRRDLTGNAQTLADALEKAYGQATALALDPNVTRNMTGYYAFNWRRYEHAIHPMTTAAIVETGFLTSPHDRQIIVNQPARSAQGIAAGITAFLTTEGLLTASTSPQP